MKTELFESSDLTPLDFCLRVWMRSEVYKRKLDTPDELLARILDAAACIKERKNKLRRTTCNLHTEVQNALWLTVGFSTVYCEL
jgi:hypothetical protein